MITQPPGYASCRLMYHVYVRVYLFLYLEIWWNVYMCICILPHVVGSTQHFLVNQEITLMQPLFKVFIRSSLETSNIQGTKLPLGLFLYITMPRTRSWWTFFSFNKPYKIIRKTLQMMAALGLGFGRCERKNPGFLRTRDTFPWCRQYNTFRKPP